MTQLYDDDPDIEEYWPCCDHCADCGYHHSGPCQECQVNR